MTYNELKQIAKPHIREGENLPSNSFLLLNQLHIPFKNEKQCEKDFSEVINPLKNNPAFLSIDHSGNKTIYFDSNTPYWNFYIFHEIAHYILGHEQNSPQNEIDADMLACILAAPVENLPTYLKTARDLSSLCKIPIDKAEMYWQEISLNFSKPHKKLWITSIILLIFSVIIGVSIRFNNTSVSTPENLKNVENEINQTITEEVHEPTTNNDILLEENTYYMTSSGTHYHEADCQYIKYKTNVISITLEEVNRLNLEPCEKCIY